MIMSSGNDDIWSYDHPTVLNCDQPQHAKSKCLCLCLHLQLNVKYTICVFTISDISSPASHPTQFNVFCHITLGIFWTKYKSWTVNQSLIVDRAVNHHSFIFPILAPDIIVLSLVKHPFFDWEHFLDHPTIPFSPSDDDDDCDDCDSTQQVSYISTWRILKCRQFLPNL